MRAHMARAYDIQQLLPHADDARLLDVVLGHDARRLDAGLVVRAGTAFSEADGSLMPWVGVEIMSQSVSAFATASADRDGDPRIGLLLGVREYRCDVERFPPGARLVARVEESTRDEQRMAVFDCWLSEDGTVVAQGRLTVFEPDGIREYLAGPAP